MKRKKKYNPYKNKGTCIQYAARQQALAVMYIGGDAYCGMVNLKTMERFNPTSKQANDLLNTQLEWTVLNAVFLRESNGKTKARFEEVASPFRCYQHQLANCLSAHHMALIEDCQKKAAKNILNLGWIATPYPADLIDNAEYLDKLFTKYGAYDCLAPWELEGKENG